MNAEELLKRTAPVLQVHIASDAELFEQLHALERTRPARIVARVVRGGKCSTREAFFSEVGAAWQLPPHFGENWDALVDCLSDMSWQPAEAYAFVVSHAAVFLNQESADTWKTFAAAASSIAERWARPSQGRPQAVFRVLLHTTQAELVHMQGRMQAAGIAAGS